MPRLPQPGADAGNWGQLLNDFLSQVHEPDGTLKTGSIDESVLASSVQTKLNTVAGQAGATGATGPQGVAGSLGATGATGPQGVAGATGAASTVPGPVGATGPAGNDGATGATGPAGVVGTAGPTGATGPAGTAGSAGATGATGPAGATTIAGISGLQAALDAKADTTSVVGANIYVYDSYADAPALPVNTVVVSITGS